MPTTTQLVISGLSRPGVMAQVAQVLGEAKVNIKAFSAPEVTGTGKLRLLVADLEGARAALKASKDQVYRGNRLAVEPRKQARGFKRSGGSADQGSHQY